MEKERQAYAEDHDQRTFIKWEAGNKTAFTLEAVIPRDHMSSWGKKQKVFSILVDGAEFD